MSIVTTETFVCSRMLVRHYVYGSYLYWIRLEKEHHIRNSNKKPLRGPGYRLVNAVKLSLQSGRNTQLRTCVILVIFICIRLEKEITFRTPIKKHYAVPVIVK